MKQYILSNNFHRFSVIAYNNNEAILKARLYYNRTGLVGRYYLRNNKFCYQITS